MSSKSPRGQWVNSLSTGRWQNSRGPCWWPINIRSGNGLIPSGTKPLPESVSTWDLRHYLVSSVHKVLIDLMCPCSACLWPFHTMWWWCFAIRLMSISGSHHRCPVSHGTLYFVDFLVYGRSLRVPSHPPDYSLWAPGSLPCLARPWGKTGPRS